MAAALTLQSFPASAATGRITDTPVSLNGPAAAGFSLDPLSLGGQNLNGSLEFSEGSAALEISAPPADTSLFPVAQTADARSELPAARFSNPAALLDAPSSDAPKTGYPANGRLTQTNGKPAHANGTPVRTAEAVEKRPKPAPATEEDISGSASLLARNVWAMAVRLGFLKSKFYGDAVPDPELGEVVVSPKADYTPTPLDQERAKLEYLIIAERGEEILSTPTALQKAMHLDLQRTSFPIAQIDVVLTDIANGVQTRVAVDILHDVVGALVELRRLLFREYLQIRDRIAGERTGLAGARATAIRAVENWHDRGVASPSLEAKGEDAWTALRAPYQRVLAAALGDAQATASGIRDLVARFEETISFSPKPHGEDLGWMGDKHLVGAFRAEPKRAEGLYTNAVMEAKDGKSPENIRHMLARQQAIRNGTLFPVLKIEKQMRPTCTVNTLQSMLAALGVSRDLMELVIEARRLLGDPYIGITTPFNVEMQLRLFRHYGPVLQVPGNRPFKTLLSSGKIMKIGLYIGDPIYQHSLLLEGLYMLDGNIYVSMRDPMSHYPIRMEISDFATVFMPGDSLQLQSVYPDAPRP